MRRIFQDYQGVVPLKNITFSILKVIEVNNSPLILWFNKENSNIWYRVFIDGVYCGIDKYENENFQIDLDDDISVTDYSDNIKHKQLINSKVEFNEANKDIKFILTFINNFKLIFKANSDGKCILNFKT